MSDQVKKLRLATHASGRATLTLFDDDGDSITQKLSADQLESLSDACDSAAGIVRGIIRERNYAKMYRRAEEDE